MRSGKERATVSGVLHYTARLLTAVPPYRTPSALRLRAVAFLAAGLGAWLAPLAAQAQSGLVQGRVRAADGAPIAGARVSGESLVSGRTADDRTDDSGRFAFIGLTRGPWVFTVEKFGYETSQGISNISRMGRTAMTFVLEIDPLRPPVPRTGVLAGIAAGEIQEDLDHAHARFDRGDHDGAIAAYEALLERVPRLTSLHLQIGHAYRAKRDYPRALAAYRAVPADTPAATEAASAIAALQPAAAAGR